MFVVCIVGYVIDLVVLGFIEYVVIVFNVLFIVVFGYDSCGVVNVVLVVINDGILLGGYV